ncbi:PIR protein [Plasmodium vivax]|nr:PIR protein [Plasmodium vivax]
MALSPENNWVEVLENLPSYKEYEKFDKVDIKNENSNHCNNLGSKDEGDKTFCKQIVQNVSQLSALENDQKIKNSCYYFQHWFFDNIAKKYYDGNEWGNNYSVAKELYNIVSTIAPLSTKMEPCKCYESGYPDVWKEEKYLHDYFQNHQDIKCNDSNKSKCEKYVNYVTYIKTLYENKEDDCCEDEELYIGGFCQSYFNCKNKYSPQNLLNELKKELQELGKKVEAPRDGGTGAVEAGKAPGSGGEERENKAKEDEVAAVTKGQEPKEKVVSGEVPKEKSADSLAQSAPEKSVLAKPAVQESVGAKPGGLESREEKAEPAKPVAAKPTTAMPAPPELAPAKPVAAKPAATKPPVAGPVVAESERAKPAAEKPVAVKAEGTVSEDESAKKQAAEEEQNEVETDEVETDEVVTTEELVAEMPSAMQHEEALGSQPVESVEQGVRAMSSYTTEPASNAIPLAIADSPNTLRTAHEGLDSNFFRNIIMAVAVLGTIFFLFYYNRVIAHYTL